MLKTSFAESVIMMLFTKDPKEIGDIASMLRNCGCCARCTLRYLGLKDTYAYRKSLQVKHTVYGNFSGSNTDGSFTTTMSNSFLSL